MPEVEILEPEPDDGDDDLAEIRDRLARIEAKLDGAGAGGKGIGCLGVVFFLWVIRLLYDVIELLGG